jgi:V/A-type H+-transporting ATPase subunit E
MQNKLQELTDKLYEEGLSKGKEEGAKIVENALKEAERILAEARQNAGQIREEAEKSAAEMKSKVESDLKMASAQTLQATRQDIENLVVAKISDAKVAESLAEPDFLKKIILAVAEKFSTQDAADMNLILPESLKAQLEPFVKGELARALGKEVTAAFSKKIAGGFRIGPKDGSYFISLTDETFKSLIGEYLRPVTRKFLFGE